MSDYDSTINNYNYQIRLKRERIEECDTQIRKNNESIDSENDLKRKMTGSMNQLIEGSSSVINKCNSINLTSSKGISTFNPDFFKRFSSNATSPEYQACISALQTDIANTGKRITALEDSNEELRREINRLNNEINKLERDKRNFISSQENTAE